MSQESTQGKKSFRVALLASFWLVYVVFPWATGWSFAQNVRCEWCWDEILRHGFAMFGYGTIGCLFYAMTTRDGTPDSFERKLWAAMGINLCFFLTTIYLTADWGIIML